MTRKLSVHIGNKPTGLQDFERIAQPAVIYSINNTVTPIDSNTLTIRRVQNAMWGRLPDAMGQAGYFKPVLQGGINPFGAARYELKSKTIYVPKIGRLNLLDYWRLGYADYYAPYNEPVLGESIDHIEKAKWLNDYTCEALHIAHGEGLALSVLSFASGNPHPDTLPYLRDAVELCYHFNGVIDLHEYGINGALIGASKSGACGYRRFRRAFDVCPPIVISEASAGNGYDTGLRGQAWVNDMIAYAIELERDDYVLGACAFQLDQGAESHIDTSTLMLYANAARNLIVAPDTFTASVTMPTKYRAELTAYVTERGGTVTE